MIVIVRFPLSPGIGASFQVDAPGTVRDAASRNPESTELARTRDCHPDQDDQRPRDERYDRN
jgi:hypothetical protein